MSDNLGFIHHYERGAAGSLTLLLLHGTGGDENDLLPLGKSLSPDASLLSPRGKVLERGMPRFFRRLAEGVFDVGDLIARTHELAAFVGAAAPHYGFDARTLVAVGLSNGANIAASILLLHPGLLRSAILYRAMVPLEPSVKPDLGGTRVLLSAGSFDPIVPSANTDNLARLLRDAGADVTLKWQAAGHSLVAIEVEEGRKWLESSSSPSTVPSGGGSE